MGTRGTCALIKGIEANRYILAACLLILSACGGGEDPALATLHIDSSPEQDAEVQFDGDPHGTTPVTIEGVSPGFHDIILKKERFKVASAHVSIDAGAEETILLTMRPRVGFLSVETEPPGATVSHEDGELLGETPFFGVELPIGPQAYVIEKENFYPLTETIEVEENFQYSVKKKLKSMEGVLSVLSRPMGASIWINNQPVPEVTPAKFTLAPGPYLISVYTKGFVQAEKQLELNAREDSTITLTMERGNVPQGMVLIPEGDFIWGEDERAPDEGPRRKVYLPAFYIDKYEVTNAQYKVAFPEYEFTEGQESWPVTGVTWYQATEYAKKTGKRLPTEAEWEKAARGTDGREFPWGPDFQVDICNTSEFGNRAPVPVGKMHMGASPYGCMHMAGNAYEWTSEWYDVYPGNEVVTTEYGQIFRVLRGGSHTNSKFQARCARRHFDRMDTARADYGFRCALNVAEGSE